MGKICIIFKSIFLRFLFLNLMWSKLLVAERAEHQEKYDVKKVEELFELMQPLRLTNVSLVAEFSDKRFPKYPMTKTDVRKHAENEIKQFIADGVLPEHHVDEARKQILDSLEKYRLNISVGTVSEMFYDDYVRLDWIRFYGTNAITSTNARPDRSTCYVILDKSLSVDIPVLEVSPLGNVILKKKTSSLLNKPVLINAIQPNQFCALMVTAMLVDTNAFWLNQKSFLFSAESAIKLLAGKHISGIKLSIESKMDANGGSDTVYTFEQPGSSHGTASKINVVVRKFSNVNKIFLRQITADYLPNLYINQIIEYGQDGYPVSVSYTEKMANADGHEYHFDKIRFDTIKTTDVEAIFFKNIPDGYLVEEEVDGERIVIRNPDGSRPTRGRKSIIQTDKQYLRLAIIGGVVFSTGVLICTIFFKRN